MDLQPLGRLLIGVGALIVVVGLLIAFGGRVPILSWLGRLPGDFSFSLGPVRVYLPLATSILLSILLTVLLTVLLQR